MYRRLFLRAAATLAKCQFKGAMEGTVMGRLTAPIFAHQASRGTSESYHRVPFRWDITMARRPGGKSSKKKNKKKTHAQVAFRAELSMAQHSQLQIGHSAATASHRAAATIIAGPREPHDYHRDCNLQVPVTTCIASPKQQQQQQQRRRTKTKKDLLTGTKYR